MSEPTPHRDEEQALQPRKRLPNRRAHELIDFSHDGLRYTAGIGPFEDGRLAEIFLDVGKAGTQLETVARDATITASLLFQQGASADTLRHAITRKGDGSAAGPLGALLDILATEADEQEARG
jgi:ribonucleoside-diphosphate reductase alpha chain